MGEIVESFPGWEHYQGCRRFCKANPSWFEKGILFLRDRIFSILAVISPPQAATAKKHLIIGAKWPHAIAEASTTPAPSQPNTMKSTLGTKEPRLRILVSIGLTPAALSLTPSLVSCCKVGRGRSAMVKAAVEPGVVKMQAFIAASPSNQFA